jgi:hypothetical protein
MDTPTTAATSSDIRRRRLRWLLAWSLMSPVPLLVAVVALWASDRSAAFCTDTAGQWVAIVLLALIMLVGVNLFQFRQRWLRVLASIAWPPVGLVVLFLVTLPAYLAWHSACLKH